jgi:adenylate cyclase class 2
VTFEVEQKFAVADRASLERRLEAMGIEWGDVTPQTDVYYAHPSRDFGSTDEALRVRRSGETNVVTYKGPKIDMRTKTRQEIEVAIEPGAESAAAMDRLLTSLGFRPVRAVVKKRANGMVNCQNRPVHVAVDDVEGLGTFIELELTSNQAGLDEARSCLAELAGRLGLIEAERRSYLELLLLGG